VNKPQFFTAYRQSFGQLKQEQVGPLEYLLDQLDVDQPASLEHAAYLLATVRHETADTYLPVKEAYWKPNAEEWRKRNLSYYPWYGRGFVQLTWKENYAKAGKKLGMDFITNPDIVMSQRIAYQILLRGCSEGWFTGKKLADYIKPGSVDYVNARMVVNKLDKAELIAGYARKFEAALRAAQYAVKPPKPVLPPMVVDLPTLRAPWKDTAATRILRVLLQTPTDDLTPPVKQAQAGFGLAADGIVGPDTWRALLVTGETK
jgi:hypothetical protein